MDNNFNNDVQPNQVPHPDQVPQNNDYSAQYAQYNQKNDANPYQPQQPAQPDYAPYQPQQPVQPDSNQYQPQQPVQPDYNQYQPQQPVQPDYNQYQNNAVQPYDYNQAGYQQPEYQQGSVYNPEPVDAPTGAAKAFGIVSFVCGIISMVACCYGVFAGIPGLIFAIISKSKFKGKNTMAQLGLIFSIIGLSLSVIWFIVAIVTGIVNGSSSGYSYRYY